MFARKTCNARPYYYYIHISNENEKKTPANLNIKQNNNKRSILRVIGQNTNSNSTTRVLTTIDFDWFSNKNVWLSTTQILHLDNINNNNKIIYMQRQSGLLILTLVNNIPSLFQGIVDTLTALYKVFLTQHNQKERAWASFSFSTQKREQKKNNNRE